MRIPKAGLAEVFMLSVEGKDIFGFHSHGRNIHGFFSFFT